MSKITSIILLLAVVFIALFGSTITFGNELDNLQYPPLNKIEIPKVEKVTLDNGIRLYFIEDKSLPIFEAQVRINCGGYLEPADKIGLATICGQVMRIGGTQKWSGDELDELLEGIGGGVETSIDRTSGWASVSLLSDYTDLGLEVLAQVLRNPVFNEDKIELAKIQERTQISRRNDDPFPITFREFRKKIYGADSPYARQTEYATINAITRDDLIEFHKTYYQPQNIQIAICGDFNQKDVLKKIEKYFGDWQKSEAKVPPPPKVDYTYANKIYYIEQKDAPQANIMIGHIGGFTLDKDYPARIVMNNILGGSFGSRLVDNVRSKEGLAYETSGRYSDNVEFPGMFYAYALTKNETISKALTEMIKQVKSMQIDTATVQEMKFGKDGYLNSFVFNFDNKTEIINRIMTYDRYGLPEDFLFKSKEAVEGVTASDVVAAALKNLHPDEMQIVVLGDKDKFDVPLEQLGFGEVITVDITIPSGEVKTDLDVTPEKIAKGKQVMMAAINAHGGADNFAKIKSISAKGTATFITPAGEMPFVVESIEQYPDKACTKVIMMGQEMCDIVNGDKGWQTGQDGKLAPKSAADIADSKLDQLRDMVHIFKGIDEPIYQPVYDGEGEFGGAVIEYVILLDQNSKKICRLGFNKADNTIVSSSYWGKSAFGEGNIEETYENMTVFDGVKIPALVKKSLDGQPFSKFAISEYKINQVIPANIFEAN